ncbi:hypothetical protein ABVK25_006046 [Lepraria finkii]|uniref:Uncharacterized protein n=1 Tax=Lepraria finkii TaxID=1340010 RepID=A0ABR4B7A7_9LECA
MKKGLASWDLACFRHPEHPGFKDLEKLSKIKYMSLHFETLDKRDEFCKEFELLENLRNRDLNDYEGTLKERKYLANNIRQH